MVNDKQKNKYTALHDLLGDLYTEKEKQREKVVVFYKEIKEFYAGTKIEWQKTEQTECENKIDELLLDHKKKEIGKLVAGFNDFMKRFDGYLRENVQVYTTLENIMKEMIKQQKNLGLPKVTQKEAGKILADLETRTAAVGKGLDNAVSKMPGFTNELSVFNEKHNAIKILDDFYSIATDLALGTVPPEFAELFKDNINKHGDQMLFFLTVYKKWHKEANAALLNLMEEQLPGIKGNENSDLRTFVKEANLNIAHNLIVCMYRLIKSQESGLIPSEHYPKLETWRAFYCQPAKPRYITDSSREDYDYLPEEEWEQYKQWENERSLLYHNWEEKRKAQWYDAMQPLNFSYMPALNELEDDYWVLYAVDIRDQYEAWKTGLERIEIVLDYNMDFAMLLKPYNEYLEALRKADQRLREEVDEKRNRRIYGKEFEKYGRRRSHYFS